jgi:type I restriction enzyme S subunit
MYIDISSVDVSNGIIENPQELIGIEAPSRARKVVPAFDIVISTCRQTRGAIAVVPVSCQAPGNRSIFLIIPTLTKLDKSGAVHMVLLMLKYL